MFPHFSRISSINANFKQIYTVTWTKDGQPLEEATKIIQSSDGKRKFKLEIPNVTAADVGQYGFRVAGKKNESYASFSLNVILSEV